VTAIADAHNDLLMELAFRSGEQNPFARHWLRQLETGGVDVQVCPISAHYEQLPDGALREALEQIVACERAATENAGEVALVRSRAELEEAQAGGRIALILSMEGAEPLGYSVDLADVFWRLGVRMVALTWNRRNPFADGLGEEATGGLSRLGVRLVERLCSLGAMIDLAHASERTYADVLEVAAGHPVLVSHAACRAVHDTPRNLHDHQLRELAEAGGVLGVMVLPPAIDPERPTVERVVDHIVHAIEVMGVEHVGLGADFFAQVARCGAARKPPDSLRPPGMELDFSIDGLEGPGDYPRLVEALESRGLTGTDLESVLRGNLLRFLSRALPDAS
jgi:membrane dipeptidase